MTAEQEQTQSGGTTKVIKAISLAVALLTTASFSSAALAQSQTGIDNRIIPHRVNGFPLGAPTAGSAAVQTPAIAYNGGPVMGTPNVYVIWYGNWNQTNGSDTTAGQQIVRDFLGTLGGSNHYAINKSYVAAGATTPSGNLGSYNETADSGSQGTRLTDAKVQAIVSGAVSGSGAKLPIDSNGVYFVLTSSNVAENSGFCNRYCGWHTSATIAGTNIKYSFVGNANRCLSSCAAQSVGPNGNAGVDGMISVIAHELEEANTDPNPRSGWTDSNGAENADKCAWTFGQSLSKAANGAYYNVTLGSRNYLVQRNLASDSKCYVDYVTKAQ